MNFLGIFGKNPKDLFLEFNPQSSHWRIVTWNFDLDSPAKRRWTIEVHKEKDQIIHFERNKYSHLMFFEANKLIKSKTLKNHVEEYRVLMNLALHSTLKYGIESNHDFMLSPVSGATALDIQNETRALQWIQASFGTLTRALDSFKSNKELVLTAACFSGVTPESGERVLRLIAFNLDIFYYMRDDQTLQIVFQLFYIFLRSSPKWPEEREVLPTELPNKSLQK